MLKLIMVIGVVALLAFGYSRHRTAESLAVQLAEARGESTSMELSRARAEGSLMGLHLMTRSDRAHLLELRQLIQIKDHLIESLQRGQLLTVTAYTPDSGETDSSPFITASNNRVREGILAVSRDLYRKGWSFGKKVYIVNVGVFTIDDLLSERARNQVDVFMFDKDKAIQFGRKAIRVYLLGS